MAAHAHSNMPLWLQQLPSRDSVHGTKSRLTSRSTFRAAAELKRGRSAPCHGWAAGSQFDMEVRTRGGFPAAGRHPSCQGCIQACYTNMHAHKHTHTNTRAHPPPPFLAAIRHRAADKNKQALSGNYTGGRGSRMCRCLMALEEPCRRSPFSGQ